MGRGAWEDGDLLTEGTMKGDRFSIPVHISNRLLGATVVRGGFRTSALFPCNPVSMCEASVGAGGGAGYALWSTCFLPHCPSADGDLNDQEMGKAGRTTPG